MGTIINIGKFAEQPKETKGSITRKRGSRKLYVDFYYHGARIVKTTGLDDTRDNWQKIREWLDRVVERIEKGTFVFADAFPGAPAEEKEFFARLEGREYRPDAQDVLFGDYAGEWARKFLEKCPSESKRYDYKRIINCWLLPHFGDMTFHQITGVALKEFLRSLVRRTGAEVGKPLAASRVRNILIPLRVIWDDACEEHRWDMPSPFSYLKRHKLIPKRKRRTRVEYEVFRFGEWMEILANMDPFYKTIAEFMVMTGTIGSEIAGLRREDIQEQQIWIRNSVVRDLEKSELKNEYRQRKVPITRSLRRLIDEAVSRSEGKYLFTMKSGRTFDIDSFRKNPWTGAFKKAKIRYRVPYTTRHTFAAWALAMGMDPNRLTSLMGHGSKEMVYEVYGRYVDGLETDAGKIMDYFGKDFIGLSQKRALAFAINHGESYGESGNALGVK